MGNYSAFLCSHPVHALRELDVLYPLRDSQTLTNEILNQGTSLLKNSVNSLLTDPDNMIFISKNFTVYDSRSQYFNYINMLSFNFLVN